MKQLVFLILLLSFFYGCKKDQETTKPEFKDLTISVYASLLVQPEDLSDLYVESSGILQSIEINAGDTVSKNQILATIKRENIDYDVKTAQINRTQAEADFKGQSTKLARLKSDIKNLKTQIQLDSLNFIRQQKLWNQNIGSKSQLEQYELIYKKNLENIVALNNQYTQQSKELETAFLLQKNRLNQVNSVSSNYSVRAKQAGKIYTLNKNEGEAISINEIFATIGSLNQYELSMQVDEVDIASIKIGNKIIVSLDAYSKEIFTAEIDKILPSKNLRTQTYTAEGHFIKKPTALYAGLSGEANIIVASKNKVLTIPLEYLFDNNKVLDQNNNELTLVLGEKNMNFVEVVSGLDSATIITKPVDL